MLRDIYRKIDEHVDYLKFDNKERRNPYTSADFTGEDLRKLRLKEESLKGAVFTNADLSGASLCGCNFDGCNFDGADLSGANIDGASFRGASMNATKMVGVHAHKTIFTYANLSGIAFDGANLASANFSSCELTNVSFNNIIGGRIRFDYSIIKNSSFRGAKLRKASFFEVIFLEKVDFTGAYIPFVTGDGVVLLSANCFRPYHVVWGGGVMAIECIQKPIDEWLLLSRDDANELEDEVAGKFYDAYRDVLVKLISR